MFSILAFTVVYQSTIKLAFYNNILIILMNVESRLGLPLTTSYSSKHRLKFLILYHKAEKGYNTQFDAHISQLGEFVYLLESGSSIVYFIKHTG